TNGSYPVSDSDTDQHEQHNHEYHKDPIFGHQERSCPLADRLRYLLHFFCPGILSADFRRQIPGKQKSDHPKNRNNVHKHLHSFSSHDFSLSYLINSHLHSIFMKNKQSLQAPIPQEGLLLLLRSAVWLPISPVPFLADINLSPPGSKSLH